MQRTIKERAKSLLDSGEANRVLAWTRGDFCYDISPMLFSDSESIEKNLYFGPFSAVNFSKQLINEAKKEGKTAVFLKPCDTYSFLQLLREHKIEREKVYVIGISCSGMLDINKIKAITGEGILSVNCDETSVFVETLYDKHTLKKDEVMLERCLNCKSKRLVVFDEIIGEQGKEDSENRRFFEVDRLDSMSSEERYAFWQNELSRCIRCNACRNACPACTCEKCVFDNYDLGTKNTAPSDSFEEQMFHIIRAFHVASRCTDCGECSRVCPQRIPLHLLNRKLISASDRLYGTYQAGSDFESKMPLYDYKKDDPEPDVIYDLNERRDD